MLPVSQHEPHRRVATALWTRFCKPRLTQRPEAVNSSWKTVCPLKCSCKDYKYDSSTAEEKEDLRWHVRRAFYFTKAILADIKKANVAGITPTLLSVGLDGFTCNRKALSAWLEVNEDIDFEIVFRFRSLNYGMQEEHVDVHANVYWAAFSSDALRKALNGDQSDQRLVQVLESMDKLQGIKDAMTGENSLKNGRNGVDTNFVFPDWQ